jgi:hypothetical protein
MVSGCGRSTWAGNIGVRIGMRLIDLVWTRVLRSNVLVEANSDRTRPWRRLWGMGWTIDCWRKWRIGWRLRANMRGGRGGLGLGMYPMLINPSWGVNYASHPTRNILLIVEGMWRTCLTLGRETASAHLPMSVFLVMVWFIGRYFLTEVDYLWMFTGFYYLMIGIPMRFWRRHMFSSSLRLVSSMLIVARHWLTHTSSHHFKFTFMFAVRFPGVGTVHRDGGSWCSLCRASKCFNPSGEIRKTFFWLESFTWF